MHIVYSDDREPFAGRPVPYLQQDAMRAWERHYRNYKFLAFVSERSDDFRERQQANREIAICQRKLDHWQRHPNWSVAAAAEARQRVDGEWSGQRER